MTEISSVNFPFYPDKNLKLNTFLYILLKMKALKRIILPETHSITEKAFITYLNFTDACIYLDDFTISFQQNIWQNENYRNNG